MRRLVSVVLLGVLLGQFVFIVSLSPGEDFWQHYYAGHALRAGVTVEEVMSGRVSADWRYPYPMFVAPLLLPISFLPPRVAFALWAALLYVALGVSTYAFAARAVGLGREAAVEATLLSLAWPVTFSSVFMGQVTPVLVSLFIAAYLLARLGHPNVAGGVLSLALIKPHIAAPVVGAVALRRKGRVVIAFAVAATILLATSLAVGQHCPVADRIQYAVGWFLGSGRTVSLVGLLRPFPEEWRLLAVACGYCAISVWWFRKQAISLVDVAYGLISCLLVSPHVPVYDLVLLTPVLVLLATHQNAFFWLALGLSSVGALRSGALWAVTLSLVLFGVALFRATPIDVRHAGLPASVPGNGSGTGS